MAKNKGGRPPKFKTVEEMEKKIDEYFDWCDNRTKDVFIPKLGDHITMSHPAPYGMAGLAYYLGMSRRALINYKKKSEFLPAIKKARRRVELDIEARMNDKETFTPGLIFSAKNNFGWKDKSEFVLGKKVKFIVGDTDGTPGKV